jgi:hypothetical protein
MYFMEYLNFCVLNTCPGGKLINRIAVWRYVLTAVTVKMVAACSLVAKHGRFFLSEDGKSTLLRKLASFRQNSSLQEVSNNVGSVHLT